MVRASCSALLRRSSYWRCWRRRERVVTTYRLRLIVLGMLGNGLYQFLFIEGLARTRVATAVLLMASTPAAIALLGRTGASNASPCEAG